MAFTRAIVVLLSERFTHATNFPSGENRGQLDEVSVNWVGSPPVEEIFRRVPTPSRTERKTIEAPSGEMCGCELFPPVVIWRSLEPSGSAPQISTVSLR